MTLQKKLIEIQQKLNAPKHNYNKFGNYSYRSCEDILEAVKPLLKEQSAALTVNDELVLIGDRYYLKATATLWDSDSDEKISNSAFARETAEKKGMDEAQITGAVSSYARKYALNGLFCIDDVKDADTRDNRSEEAKEESIAKKRTEEIEKLKISSLKIQSLNRRCTEEGVSTEKICSLYKVKSFDELTEKQFSNIIANWSRVKES